MNNLNQKTHMNNFKDFKKILSLKNKKVINLMNSFWIICILLNILAITILSIFSKYYITINLFYIGKELATTSIITLCFSFICAIMFEHYFLKQ